MKCKVCGGTCSELGGGRVQCDFCGATFSASELKEASAPRSVNAPQRTGGVRTGADIYEENVKGVLEITCAEGSGSGYLVSQDGYALTNAHVVATASGKPCALCSVKLAGETVQAQVVAVGTERVSEQCSNKDLALIKLSRVPFGATPVRFGDYNKVRTGETVFVIGNSLGCGNCITSGIVSDRDRNGQLMYDCATNPGNSGGPVFNAEGLVIGTHVSGQLTRQGVKAEGMNRAIPVSAVLTFLKNCPFRVVYR